MRLALGSMLAKSISVCGENGSGKSTLMKVLCGIYPHGIRGEIILLAKPSVRSIFVIPGNEDYCGDHPRELAGEG